MIIQKKIEILFAIMSILTATSYSGVIDCLRPMTNLYEKKKNILKRHLLTVVMKTLNRACSRYRQSVHASKGQVWWAV